MVQMVLMFPQVYMAVFSDEEVQNCLCIKFTEKPRLSVVEAICFSFKMAVSIWQWNTLTKKLNTEVPGVYGILPSYTHMRQWYVFLVVQVGVRVQLFCMHSLCRPPGIC
jgi:hypothetical protein